MVEIAIVIVVRGVEFAGQSVAVEAQLMIVETYVVQIVEVEYEVTDTSDVVNSGGEVGVEVASVEVTGQMVVEIATATVVRDIELAGQSITVGAHLITDDT